ncbi:hypothetical protein TNCV_1322821 [Trichonephila clavipes]|nr:hypothetical protein TNCV_1322821 [Trichonephila clavipes]
MVFGAGLQAVIERSRIAHMCAMGLRLADVYGSIRNGHRDSNSSSARHLAMARTDTEAFSEGAACVWMTYNKTVGAMRAFRMMERFSRLFVCRGCPKRGRCVPNLCLFHWSQHLLIVKSELPRWQAVHQTDHPVSIIPMILSL